MATDLREELRRLVEKVPDGDLVAALRYLEYLAEVGEHPAMRALLTAPMEGPEPDEVEMLDEVEREIDSGEETVPHEEVEKMLLRNDS